MSKLQDVDAVICRDCASAVIALKGQEGAVKHCCYCRSDFSSPEPAKLQDSDPELRQLREELLATAKVDILLHTSCCPGKRVWLLHRPPEKTVACCPFCGRAVTDTKKVTDAEETC